MVRRTLQEAKQIKGVLLAQTPEYIAASIVKRWKGRGRPTTAAIIAWLQDNGVDGLLNGQFEAHFGNGLTSCH